MTNHTDHTGQFEVICRQNGQMISAQTLDDPFIHTTLRPKGLRAAWDALTGRMELSVHVSGKHNAVYRAVMTADYTPDPPREQTKSTTDFCGYQKQ